MVEVDFSGNFLSSDKCKAGDIGVFIDEGKYDPVTKGGKTWKQLIITVEVNQKQYSHGFRSAEGKRFQDTYGTDTKNWIGKKFSISFIPYIKQDKTVGNNIEIIPVKE